MLGPTRAVLLLAVTLFVVSCGGGSGSDEPSARLVKVADITFPTSMAQRPGTAEFFVGQRSGQVHRFVRDGTRLKDEGVVLDLHKTVGVDPGQEGGLLGLVFAPDGKHLYIAFTQLVAKGGGNRKLVEYAMSGDGVDAGSARELINLPVEAFVHMGGSLVFGPDGFLYIGLGDHAAFLDSHNTGQDPKDLFASILRVDPSKRTGSKPYGIPAGNPYADGGGAPEVWMIGVRNPWRFSFDRKTGDMWVGDVGDDEWEEVDYLPANDAGRDAGRGVNLGWSIYEGKHRDKFRRKLVAPKDAVPPIYEWSHKEGCAVIGGYVYRGHDIKGLDGQYLFADLCNGKVQRLQRDGSAVKVETLAHVPQVDSFAQDANGEIYVVTEKGLFRLSPSD